jgi:tRNA (guanine-N7-)-methyltransferase
MTENRLNFYGRRKGRPLRKAMAELLETDLPRWRLPRTAADLPALFPHAPQDIWLEIGFGGGEHLAARAAAAPQDGFIGAEPFINGVASLLRHRAAGDYQNILIWDDDVRLLLPGWPDASLAGVYILFPDPWPKTRHAARRIVSPTMLDQLARLIRPGGLLRLASDHPVAKSWLLEETTRHRAFFWTAARPQDWRNPPPDWPGTRYMKKAEKEGRQPSWFDFRRIS